MSSTRRSTALLIAVLAATALAVTTAAAGGTPALSSGGTGFQVDAANASTNASITVANQSRDGRSVFVASATLPDGGFVVLERAGPNGSVVGVSLPLGPGTHRGRITLRGVPGTTANLSRLGANATLVATLHRDTDGDGRFEGLVAADTDGAYTTNGTPVADRARVTVPPAERPTTPALAFPNGTTNGTTVTVGPVTLPEGGYVGVHRDPYTASNASRGTIAATDYLAPGRYRTVNVRVGARITGSNVTGPNGTVRLGAVAYRDTDDDRRFQYVPSNGSEDGSYVDDGPVNATAVVAVDASDGNGTAPGNATRTENTTRARNATATPTPERTTTVDEDVTTIPTTATPTSAGEGNGATAATVTTSATATTASTATTSQTASGTPTAISTDATAIDTSTDAVTSTDGPATGTDDEATPYGGGTDGRDGFLDNPLLPALVLTFAVFVVLVAVTGE